MIARGCTVRHQNLKLSTVYVFFSTSCLFLLIMRLLHLVLHPAQLAAVTTVAMETPAEDSDSKSSEEEQRGTGN